jgi:hypothetical protein
MEARSRGWTLDGQSEIEAGPCGAAMVWTSVAHTTEALRSCDAMDRCICSYRGAPLHRSGRAKLGGSHGRAYVDVSRDCHAVRRGRLGGIVGQCAVARAPIGPRGPGRRSGRRCRRGVGNHCGRTHARGSIPSGGRGRPTPCRHQPARAGVRDRTRARGVATVASAGGSRDSCCSRTLLWVTCPRSLDYRLALATSSSAPRPSASPAQPMTRRDGTERCYGMPSECWTSWLQPHSA